MNNSILILYNNTADTKVCDIISDGCVPVKYKICDAKIIDKKVSTSKKGEKLGISFTLKVEENKIFSTFNANRKKYNNTDFDAFIKRDTSKVEVYLRQSYVAAIRINK